MYYAYNLTMTNNSVSFSYFKKEFLNHDFIAEDWNNLVEQIRHEENRSKLLTYKLLNRQLKSPTVYENNNVLEKNRINFTRYRLSSHNLKIETDRWQRKPREERKCICNNVSIQDELHVLKDCELTQSIRNSYDEINFTNFDDFFNCEDSTVCIIISKIVKIYENL